MVWVTTLVHEAPVVGDEHELARPGDQKFLQPADRGDIEIVVRLVEEEQVEVGQEDLGQVEPDLEAARELGRALLPVGGREAEAGQDLLHPPDLAPVVRGQAVDGLLQDRRPP